MPNEQRLIDDYIPGEAISAGARRRESIRMGRISTLHLGWAHAGSLTTERGEPVMVEDIEVPKALKPPPCAN